MKLILIYILMLGTSHASTKLLSSELNFTAIGKPAFIKANGSLPLARTDLVFESNSIQGTAEVELINLDSGIELRDKHLKEKYLQVEKYPKSSIEIPKQEIKYNKKIVLKAFLNLHGKKQEIILTTEFFKKDKMIKMLADFEIELSKFEIETPSFQGISAANKVKVKLKSKFEI